MPEYRRRVVKRRWLSDADLPVGLTPVATQLVAAARSLRQFLADPASREEEVAARKEQQREARALVHDLIVRLDGASIALFERTSVRRIAADIGAVIDAVAGTARRAVACRIDGVREPAVRLAATLATAAERLEGAVSGLAQRAHALEQRLEFGGLEEEGVEAYYDGLRKLLAEAPPLVELLKWKEVYDGLGESLHRAARVARLLNSACLGP